MSFSCVVIFAVVCAFSSFFSLLMYRCYSDDKWSKVYINDQIPCPMLTLKHPICVELKTHSGLKQTFLVPSTNTQHTFMNSMIILLSIYEFTMHQIWEVYLQWSTKIGELLIIRNHKYFYRFFFNLKLFILLLNPQLSLESLKHRQM